MNSCSLDELAASIPDGARLAVPRDPDGVAVAATRAIVRRAPRGLHLVCLPTSGIQADVLIGAGCVATIETSAVALGEYGTAPRFAQAVRDGLYAAYWRRPKACLDPSVRAGISGFSMVDEQLTQRALAKLAADLESGEWRRRNAALLDIDELDVGYRLVIAERDPV